MPKTNKTRQVETLTKANRERMFHFPKNGPVSIKATTRAEAEKKLKDNNMDMSDAIEFRERIKSLNSPMGFGANKIKSN